jgi:cytosine/adenosine deaminase-related metal-dependent hydrolase
MRLLIEARDGAVGVEGGLIVPVEGRFDVVVRVPDGELRPGLINAHDHLHRNHYGRLGTPPYANAYDWGRDIHRRFGRLIDEARAVPRRRALEIGAWKNLFAGVTTVVHHDAWEPEFERAFPIRVARLRCAHSLEFERDATAWQPGSGPFAVHVAEGTDAAAANEVRELDRRGLLTSLLLAVHVVGADADGIARLRAAGSAVVWCPTSNLFLLGATAPRDLLTAGMDVLLGSDSMLSGAGTLLDELRCARAIGLVSDERLTAAVGHVAARRLGLREPSLDLGAPADVMVVRRPLLTATVADVALVVVGGLPRVVDPELTPSLGPLCAKGAEMTLHGVTRWVLEAAPGSLGFDAIWEAAEEGAPAGHLALEA